MSRWRRTAAAPDYQPETRPWEARLPQPEFHRYYGDRWWPRAGCRAFLESEPEHLAAQRGWIDFFSLSRAAIAIDGDPFQRLTAQRDVDAPPRHHEGWSRVLGARRQAAEASASGRPGVKLGQAAGLPDRVDPFAPRRVLHDIGNSASVVGTLKPAALSDPSAHRPAAPGLRLQHTGAHRLPAVGARHPLLPPRALGWRRLPARPGGRLDPAGGTPIYRRRCVGRAGQRETLSRRLDRGRSDGSFASECRQAI